MTPQNPWGSKMTHFWTFTAFDIPHMLCYNPIGQKGISRVRPCEYPVEALFYPFLTFYRAEGTMNLFLCLEIVIFMSKTSKMPFL